MGELSDCDLLFQRDIRLNDRCVALDEADDLRLDRRGKFREKAQRIGVFEDEDQIPIGFIQEGFDQPPVDFIIENNCKRRSSGERQSMEAREPFLNAIGVVP